jgi:hypothetical protein
MSVFVSLTALPLIAIGFFKGISERRKLWLTMTALLFAIACYGYTPLGRLLYDYAPGFAKFRSHSKFIYEATIFIALLAASGFDAVLRGRAQPRRAMMGMIAFVVAIAAATFVFVQTGLGSRALISLWSTKQTFDTPPVTDLSSLMLHVLQNITFNMAQTCILCCFVAFIFWTIQYNRRWAYLLVGVSLCEMLVFASPITVTFSPEVSKPAQLTKWYAENPGDYRMYQAAFFQNSPIAYGGYEIWGYDPMVQRRYSELLSAAIGKDPDDADMYVAFPSISSIFPMLRCRYVMIKQGDRIGVIRLRRSLQHAQIYYNYETIPERRASIYRLIAPDFNCDNDVVLEKSPGFDAHPEYVTAPAAAVWKNTDTLEVNAQTNLPGILLITDTYSNFWRATAFPDSIQKSYDVQPGNYAQIAIPLSPGNHHFLLRYCPPIFPVGAAISSVGVVLFILLCGYTWRRDSFSKKSCASD